MTGFFQRNLKVKIKMSNGFEWYAQRRNAYQNRIRFIRQALGRAPFEQVTPEMNGPHFFGYGTNGLPVAIQMPTRNSLFIGEPGSGKTTAAANFILNGLNGEKIIAFDSIKHDYRHLIRYNPNTLVLSFELGTYKDNFLQPPPGLTDDEWDPIITEIYSQPFKVPGGAGSEQYFYCCLKELKRLVHPRIPTTGDLLDFMKSKKEPTYSEKRRYSERNMIRLSAINEDIGRNINVSEGFPLDFIVDGDFDILVIELSAKADMAALESDTQIFKILKYRMKLSPARRQKGILFLVDECKKQFGLHRDFGVRSTGNISNLALMVSSAREFSVGFIFSDQSVTSLHPILFELCGTFALFKTNADTTFRMGRIIGLSNEQILWLTEDHGLEVGQCVLKTGNFPPMLVNIPSFIYEKDVTDEEIRF